MSGRVVLTIVIALIFGTTYVNRQVVVEALLSALPYIWIAAFILVFVLIIISALVRKSANRL